MHPWAFGCKSDAWAKKIRGFPKGHTSLGCCQTKFRMSDIVAIAQALLALLDSRSFSTIWYWLILAIGWSMAGRHVLGVPPDVVHRVLRKKEEGQDQAAFALLDWLSLMLPRWRIAPMDGAIVLGISCFVLVVLLMLGFVYGLEMAQALFLLLGPLAFVALLQFRLAVRLGRLLDGARSNQLAVYDAAQQAARQMRRLRLAISAMSIVVVAIAAYWGALWLLAHPYGF